MSRFGGYPGMGGGNMNQLLKQAQKMQADMLKTQEDIEAKEVEVTSGGGAITLVMTGKKRIKSIKIKKEVVDSDDVEMLEDLIMTAVNEGIAKIEDVAENEMKKYIGKHTSHALQAVPRGPRDGELVNKRRATVAHVMVNECPNR